MVLQIPHEEADSIPAENVRPQIAPSPFLGGTKIQYARLINEAVKLVTLAETNGECWDCHLIPNAKGYSNTCIRYERFRAHRLVYAVFVEFVPSDMFVLHSCDNRRCINPAHLFLGTAADNTADMIAKGRWKTDPEASVRQKAWTRSRIEPLLKQGMKHVDIAKELGIAPSTVGNHARAILARD